MFKAVSLALAAVLSLALAAPSLAAEKVINITVEGKPVRVPVPEGLCVPTGDYVSHAEAVARIDEQNMTLLTLYSCAEMAANQPFITHYAHLKMPLAIRNETIPLSELLQAYKEEPSAFAAAVNQGANDPSAAGRMSEVLDMDVKVEAGIKPVGADAYGIYLAGTLTFDANGKQDIISVAAGMTSLKGTMVSINIYGPGGTVRDVARQVKEAKAATAALVAAN